MPLPFLIIDGYNLMHAAGMARSRYGPGGLEKSRNRLLNFVKNRLRPEELVRTTIVFDAGRATVCGTRESELEGMTVLFSEPGGDADTLIEELVASHSAPKLVRLVSSDHRLQKAARRRRARFVDSEDFFEELDRRESRIAGSNASADAQKKQHPKFSGKISEEETQAWLEVFGDVPEASELRDDYGDWQREIDEWIKNTGDEPEIEGNRQ